MMPSYDKHLATGRRLVEEGKRRYSYWLMTDCELPGGEEFKQRCDAFDRIASRDAQAPSLEYIRALGQDCP
jgi:hypothetical protein